jgi:large conductance mechanosensitive channel
MGFRKEFKHFAVKGNVIDLAVAVVVGGAFGKIVSSLVADIIMPAAGLLINGINFTELKLVLKGAAGVTVNIGIVTHTLIDFTIIVFCLKAINKLNRKKNTPLPPAELKPSNEEILLVEIRDLLKNKQLFWHGF